VTTAIQNIETYLDAFSELHRTAHQPQWLMRMREEAFARFCRTGFPTTHDEDWRFTNVAPIADTPFVLPTKAAEISPAELHLRELEGAAARLVFVDGQFAEQLSSIGNLPDGVTVSGLKNSLQADIVEAHLGRYLDVGRDPFSALNAAFVEDGAFLHIARGKVLEAPIHLLFISTSSDRPTMTHPRNLLLIEDQGQATVVEEYVSLGDGKMFSNSVTELVAGENAHVSHYMIEREHKRAFNVSTLRIQQGRSANVASHSVLIGGGLVRNNVHPVLAGEGGECLINGLFIGEGRQHLDNYMHVEHASPHCSSRQFYNGILDEKAHGVFHGRIVVHKAAQKTDAKQTNRNLLLSDDAQIDTKPQLEIYADDVKCTHGATIGQIEENALFYLQSRGIDEISARKLLLLAFASECVERMHEGVARAYAEGLIQRQVLSLSEHKHSASGGEQERSWEEAG
jgi:Fe-S cluster assembly protein SufD